MPITTATRKPVTDLTATDLETFPVWEFVIDEENVEGQDETWVKPVDTAQIPADNFSISVAAALKLANGSVYPGVMFCDTDSGLEVSAIALLTTQGRILFSAYDSQAKAEANLAKFGLSIEQVFPVAFCTRAPLASTSQYGQGQFTPLWI